MSTTIDNICTNIETKFDSIKSLFNIYNNYELLDEDNQIVTESLQKIDDLKESYVSSTLCILSDYYMCEDEATKKQLYNKFIQAFHSSNIIGDLERIFSNYTKFKKKYKISDPEIAVRAKSFETSHVDEQFENVGSDFCTNCNRPYEIDEKISQYFCKKCAKQEKMDGAVFMDEQFFYQEGKRTKHGKYDSIKYAKLRLDCMQGKETTEIPNNVINDVKKCIKREQLWIENLNCEIIRKYLKMTGHTDYNHHAPKIMFIITGIPLVTLTEQEETRVLMYISRILQIFRKINGDDDSNCPYHPYFLYKTIEQVLKSPRDAKRRKSLLSCAHLQARNTLIVKDKLWFLICDDIPEFTKIPTEANKNK